MQSDTLSRETEEAWVPAAMRGRGEARLQKHSLQAPVIADTGASTCAVEKMQKIARQLEEMIRKLTLNGPDEWSKPDRPFTLMLVARLLG